MNYKLKNKMRDKSIGGSRSAEEVVSMFLGLVIVLVVFGLVVSFFQRRRGDIEVPGLRKEASEEVLSEGGKQEEPTGEGKYVVKRGDSLWKIAQSQYNSGYKWVEIARLNKLANPGLLAVGQELELPKLEVEKAETIKTIEEGSYVVEKGDCLWNIALRAYGDGYAWVDLWQANKEKLNSPDLLEIGMELKIAKRVK